VTVPPLITDTLARVLDAGPLLYAGAPVAVAVLIVLALVLRRVLRSSTPARIVSTLATVIGLGWTAQGMWDSAVNAYRVPVQIASVLFILFEALMVSQMLRAHEYRADRPRRPRCRHGPRGRQGRR
jgi:hypothetical protein